MKIGLSLGISLLLIWILTIPSFSEAAIPAEMEIEPDSAPFDLYFSDEPVVEATSRYPKALSRIAENVTVISAAEIKAANVHTLAEILNRAAGMFVSFNGQDFGSSSTLYIHGSTNTHQHHTLVLLDGIKYNYSGSGTAETNGIPVSIIERIEIVKGPASSAWGSALGGVINIVTKESGNMPSAESDLFMSYGEAQTRDIRAETVGKAGVGYYLYAGKQSSDGIRDNRIFDNENVYGKLSLELPRQSKLRFIGFYTRPEQKYGDFPVPAPPVVLSSTGKSRDLSLTSNFESRLADNLDLTLMVNFYSRKYIQRFNIQNTNDRFLDTIWQEENRNIGLRLVRSGTAHTLAAGLEYNKTEFDQTNLIGLLNENTVTTAAEDHWGLYLNDTVELGKFTVIPGIRYDYHSISDDFISPSLGGVYQYRPDTLFRISIARGFSKPYLGLIDGEGNLFYTINPDLEPEKIWSWQAGLETSAFEICRFKTSLFFHDIRDLWSRDSFGKVVNSGKNERLGYEIEFETIPIHDFSLSTNFTSIYEDNTEKADDHLYNFNIVLVHDNPELWRTELFGHYVWWQAGDSDNGKYDDFLWDLNLSRRTTLKGVPAKFFLKVHNLFNSSQYWKELIENPGRWVEGGLTVTF